IREPKQEGIRRISIERPSSTNIVSIGFKHQGFPSEDWFVTSIMLEVLASGPESILQKLLVDTGKASSVESMIEPGSEVNLAFININLAPGQNHDEIEHLTLITIKELTNDLITPLVKKAKAHIVTSELYSRDSSSLIAGELTEYVSSGQWEIYGKTIELLEAVTVKKVRDCLTNSFIHSNLTIGHFIGK
ncbi:insulinase family protein, partial [Candidatus Kaiserbacteria bacterium]|nr:insulinase family protein [Candidatus Kaiserbacteria bacterium]